MKVTIRGNNPITSEQFKSIIDTLNKDYSEHGLIVKNMTCYVRFINEEGKTVEPLEDGCQIERIFTINTVKETKQKESKNANNKD